MTMATQAVPSDSYLREDRSHQVIIINVLFPTLATICVVGRFASRKVKRQYWGLDDWTIVIALVKCLDSRSWTGDADGSVPASDMEYGRVFPVHDTTRDRTAHRSRSHTERVRVQTVALRHQPHLCHDTRDYQAFDSAPVPADIHGKELHQNQLLPGCHTHHLVRGDGDTRHHQLLAHKRILGSERAWKMS